MSAVLVLEDGRVFTGEPFGAEGRTVGEAVFATGMTGYQETLTDPSYHRQVVVLTAPHIGNTGWNDEDDESARIWVAGLVIRDPSVRPSSWRSRRSLEEEMIAQHVVGISGVDTRALTRHLRERGAMRGVIAAGREPSDQLRARLLASPSMEGLDLASRASATSPRSEGAGPHVVAYDFGMKRNIVRMLVQAGCRVTVVPVGESTDLVG